MQHHAQITLIAPLDACLAPHITHKHLFVMAFSKQMDCGNPMWRLPTHGQTHEAAMDDLLTVQYDFLVRLIGIVVRMVGDSKEDLLIEAH